MWYKKLFVLTFTIFGFLSISTAQTRIINGITYEKIDSKWYQLYNGNQFEVNESIVTVKFSSGVDENQKNAIAQINNCNIMRSNSLGYYDLEITGSNDVLDVVENLLMDSTIELAEPNTYGEFFSHANDTYYNDQWHLYLEDGTSSFGIDAYKAWDKETGDPDIIIAILDSGTDILHEDLDGNIWVNPGEDLDGDGVVWDTDDLNDLDDDGNGYVDDLSGWDFLNNNNTVTGSHFHGTHVAGVVAAETNNTQGIAGISGGWYSTDEGCKMLICLIGGYFPVNSADVDDAILYAVEEGANIITLAIGIGYSEALENTINSVFLNNNCFIDCSSGNFPPGSQNVNFPANVEHCFAVGGNDQNGSRRFNSSYGTGLMVVAPGEYIKSTRKDNTYGSGNGTSYAAPQVAATAGLILSRHPDFTAQDIEEIICLTAMKLVGYNFTDGYEYGSWNNEVGYGKLNANRALGIKEDVTSNLTLIEGNYIRDEVHVLNGSTLTLAEDSRFHFLKTGKLVIDAGATVKVKSNALITSKSGSKIEVHGNLYFEGTDINLNEIEVKVKNNGTVTIKNGDNIHLLLGTQIFVEPFGSLIVENNASVYGSPTSIIDINGSIQVGTGVTFDKTTGSSSFGELWLNNQTATVTLNDITFKSGQLINYTLSLNIVDSYVYNTYLGSHRGFINIDHSTFDGVWTYFTNTTNPLPFFSLTVIRCTFKNESHAGLTIDEYDYFSISDNNIFNCGDGISIFNSGRGSMGNQNILDNGIFNNSTSGISFYNTTASVSGNYIHDNNFGVKFYNNSNVAFYGNPNASSYSEINLVEDNISYEVFSSGYSFPWYFRYNAFIDEDNSGGQSDPLIYYEYYPGDQIPKDVRYNWWGNNFDPEDDFYPDVFNYIPTWYPSGGGKKSSDIALQIFLDAKEQFENEEYTDAEESFEEVVELYPKTQYASAAMKELFALEQFTDSDFVALQQYYETNDSIQADTVLTKLAVFLANKCEIELENWQIAIDHFEDIIENPETTEDSIFAIIDLGHTYFLMGDDSASRSAARGRMEEHIPKSREAFAEKRNYLLSLLPLTEKHQQQESELEKLMAGTLLQNIPNPFSNSTTIHYKLDEQSLVAIKVFDHLGKEIRNILQTQKKDVGVHSVELDMIGMASGIYFYSLYINGQHTDTKKMVVK